MRIGEAVVVGNNWLSAASVNDLTKWQPLAVAVQSGAKRGSHFMPE
jgi:hypothetical protein